MDQDAVRSQLREVQEALKRNDEERDILVSLIHGLEGWLRLHGTAPVVTLPLPTMVVPTEATGRRSSRVKGTISLRQAVQDVLKEAQGAPLHVKEILRRAQERGAVTESRDPQSVIDFVTYGLKTRDGAPVEKVAPRTWRWAGTPSQRTS